MQIPGNRVQDDSLFMPTSEIIITGYSDKTGISVRNLCLLLLTHKIYILTHLVSFLAFVDLDPLLSPT